MPEMVIRRGLHASGFRFRLQNRKLPGRPDLTLPKFHAVVFINGCFWHRHQCEVFKWPKTREEFWKTKLNNNASRDTKNRVALQNSGWRTAVVWECALTGKLRLPLGNVLTDLVQWLQSTDVFFEIAGGGCGRSD